MPPGRLAIALVAMAVVLPAHAAAPATVGKVRFVTARRAYLGAGRAEGLSTDAAIQLSRNGRPVGVCKIDKLGDHEASCPFATAHAGDSFALPERPAQGERAPRPLAPAPSAAKLARAAQAFEEEPVEKVEYTGAARTLSRSGASLFSASVGHAAFVTVNGSSFEQTRLELQLNGIDIRWAGFRAFAHLTAVLSSVMPAEQRFRAGDVAQVYLWEAAFSSRDVGRSYAISVGRIWPHHTPGLALIDGAQLGWRRKDGSAEVGVYGGLIPDAMTLYPSGTRYTAGVYAAYTLAHSGKGKTLRILSTEGRIGLRGAPGPGLQLELEWAVLATLGSWFDFGAQLRVSIGAGQWTLPAFESGRVHASAHPTEQLRIVASFRYLDPRGDYDALLLDLFDARKQMNAQLGISWDPKRWLSLSLQSGLDSAVGDASATRAYVGPELGFPRLFRGHGGLAIGYREELGWFVGRNVYLQATGAIGERFRALLRLNYFEDRPNAGADVSPYRELGAYAHLEGRILRWLSARVTLIGRVGIDYSGEELRAPGGVVVRAELAGSL